MEDLDNLYESSPVKCEKFILKEKTFIIYLMFHIKLRPMA